jgi:iron uptake system component EfeO
LAAICVSNFALAQADATRDDIEPTQIILTEAGCQPNAIAAEAGKITFLIHNNRKGEGEWEILNQEEFVVDEREHIPPGVSATMTANIDSGVYEMVCGLLSSPVGTLTVAATDAGPAKPSVMDLIGPLAEYKVCVKGEVDALVAGVKKLVDAIKVGNLEEAQSVYAPAHLRYERIEPIAELFNDLDGAMDSREDDFEKKAEDPKFLGFHRIEKGIFADKSTNGLRRSPTN